MLSAPVGGGALTDAPPLLQCLQVRSQVSVRCYSSMALFPTPSAPLCLKNILSALSCAQAELHAITMALP